MFKLIDLIRQMPVFAPEGEGAAAGAADAAGAGDAGGNAGGGDAGSDAGAADAGGAADVEAKGAPWWDKLSDAQKTYVTATGRTKEDPLEVLPGIIDDYLNAQKRLGNSPDKLITKPKEGQPLPDWMRENAEAFGLPKEVDGYKVARPEGLPKEIPWNDALEAQARELAFKNGVPPEAHQAYVSLFAEHVKGLYDQSAEQLARADAEMREALAKEWGGQMDARITQAQQAAGILAEKAGLDSDALAGVAQVLSAKVGDANTMKIFHAMFEAIGDDASVSMGRNASGFGMTPAEARAELARMQSEGGEYYEATKAGNQAKVRDLAPRLQQLHKLAAQR
jgi:hypothetical protein